MNPDGGKAVNDHELGNKGEQSLTVEGLGRLDGTHLEDNVTEARDLLQFYHLLPVVDLILPQPETRELRQLKDAFNLLHQIVVQVDSLQFLILLEILDHLNLIGLDL